MIRFLRIFLVLSSLLTAVSCGSVKEVNTKEEPTEIGVHAPLAYGYNTVLYKAKVKLYGKFYSGLFLFKYTEETKVHNVVFLTEVGLTLFELKYEDNKFEIVKMSSIFNNEKAVNALKNDIELLIYDINNSPEVILVGDLALKKDVRARKAKRKYYFYGSDNEVYKIKRNSFLSSVDVSVDNYNNGFPKSISFDHRGIKLNIDLKLLKQN